MVGRPPTLRRASPRPPKTPTLTVLMDEGFEDFAPYRDPDAGDDENDASARLGIATFEAGQRQIRRRNRLN